MAELQTLQHLIETLPGRGDAPAVLALQKDGTERWPYDKLADHVRRLAAGLLESGIEPGDRVAIMAGNRPEWIVACLATLQAGGVVVPVDVQLSGDTLAHVVGDADPKLTFCSEDAADRLDEVEELANREAYFLDARGDDERSWRRLLREGAQAFPGVEPDDPAVIFYTSGTTGRPKGVPLTHRNLAFQLNSVIATGLVNERDRLLLPLPLHHVYPFTIGMLTPLALGLALVFPQALTGPALVRALKEGEISVLIGVPRLYRALGEAIEARAKSRGKYVAGLFHAAQTVSGWLRRLGWRTAGKYLLHSLHKELGPKLRVLASGGSPLDPELARKLETLGWQVAVGYGLTETSPLLTVNLPGRAPLSSVGKPLEGVQIRIDPSAAPEGTEGQGEILARGPNVFKGYRNMPDETKGVFTQDGWFRTGDLGHRDDDGNLYVVGRASTMIVTESGKNVQPDDVEEAYAQHPYIREIGVLQKDNRLVAVVVPDLAAIQRNGDGGNIEEAVRDAIGERSQRLPSYQRVSDFAMTREELERTRLGKLRRHLLPERYDRAKRGEDAPVKARRGPAPVEEMSEEDRRLLERPGPRAIWDWLAQRYPDQPLTPDSNPQLDLGIDSMEWLNLTLEIRQRVGVEISEEAIGRINTVRDLLREVAEQKEQGAEVSREMPWENPEEALSEEQQAWLAPTNWFQRFIARTLYAINGVLMRVLFQLRVEGRENLPAHGPYILAPNHSSTLDGPSVAAAVGGRALKNTHWAVWTGAAFRNPFLAVFARPIGVLPIPRAQGVISSLAFGAAVLKRGKNLVWFPEGTRSRTGELQPFKAGIGLLLKHFKVPVVPIYISGVHEALPLGKTVPRFRRITVIIGKPIDAGRLEQEAEGDEPQDRIANALHDRVAELAQHG